ncbi:MAG: DUF6240 domain-containing protein [Lachnospirales bacterium]
MKIENNYNILAQNNNSNQFKKNDIFTATVVEEKDNNYILKNKNILFSISKENFTAKTGDDYKFKVIEPEPLTLENLSAKSEDISKYLKTQLKEENILDMFEKNNVYKDVTSEDYKKTKEMAEQVARKISSSLKYASNNANSSAIRELLAEGIDLCSINLNILKSVVNEINSRPVEATPKEIGAIIEEKIKDILDPKAIENKKKIIEKMGKNGLKITDDNIKSVENAIFKSKKIKEDGYPLLLKENKELTINNMYTATYKASEINLEENLKVIKDYNPLYKDLANNLNLPFNGKTKEIFANLLGSDLPITTENINKVEEYKNAVKNITLDKVIDNAIQSLLQKKDQPINSNTKNLHEKNLNIMVGLQKIDLNKIAYSQKDFTLSSLISAEAYSVPLEDENIEMSFRKQISQLSLKLSYQSTLQLALRGVDLAIETAQSAYNKLTAVENEVYKNAFDSLNLTSNEGKIATMRDFFNETQEAKINKFTFSMANIDNATFKDYTRTNTTVVTAYETFETKISSKHNENFSKVKDQLGQLLKNLGLNATEENLKTSEILSRSNIDVNIKNINDVKNLMLQYERISSISPRAVANLIDKGYNPLEMKFPELMEYMDAYEDELGQGKSDKIVKQLLQLEKNSDKEDMEAVKAVYRVLNIIEKRNVRSIGKILESNQELTLENLLNSEKYLKSVAYKSDYTYKNKIGDDYNKGVFNPQAITNIIGNAVNKNYNQNLLDALMRNGNYSEIKSALEEDTTVESLIKSLKNSNNNSEKITEDAIKDIYNKLVNAKNIDHEQLVKYAISGTLDGILRAVKSNTKENLKSLKEKNKNLKIEFDEINKDYIENIREEGNLLDITIGEIYKSDYETVDIPLAQSILKDLQVYNNLNAAKNNEYYAPIKLPFSKEDTFVNMYVLNPSSPSRTIGVSLNTDGLGNIRSICSLKNNELSLTFLGNKEALEQLKSTTELFNIEGYNVNFEFKEE